MSLPIVKKRMEEEFFIGLKFISPDLERDQQIVTAIASVDPDESGGLELLGPTEIEGDQVSQFITGGTDGDEYFVKFLVTTSQNNTYEESILVIVRDFVP